jgi:uncharacterized membrane protein
LYLTLPASVSAAQAALHADPVYCLTAVLWLSVCGIFLEQKTVVGKALSAPLTTMAAALVLANAGVVPFSSPVYGLTNRFLVPLAVPLLLYDSDLRRVLRDTGTLLLAFTVGAVGTVVGTLAALPVVPMRMLGSDAAWRIACALAARHIGGAINFVAVADTLNISGSAVSAAIAADNVVVALYFALLFALAKSDEPDGDDEKENAAAPNIETELDYSLPEDSESDDISSDQNQITLPSLAMAIAVASSLVTAGRILTKALLPTGTSSLPLASVLTVLAATSFPRFFQRIRGAGTAVGILFIQMFFAASGAAGSIALVFRQAPSLFAFSALQIAVHFVFLMTVGRGVFRLPAKELYLASNANVGGPTTAAAMAQAKHWKRLVLPALLVGILGYATATALALALGPILVRLPILFSNDRSLAVLAL